MAFKTGINRRIVDLEGHAFFLTFHCYRRYSLLSRDRCKAMALSLLNIWSARCGVGVAGFVLMNNHVHALVRPIQKSALSDFLREWKARSAVAIAEYLQNDAGLRRINFMDKLRDRKGMTHIWTQSTHAINIYDPKKAIQKLEYMHGNPVRGGLVDDPCAWKWSTASYYLKGLASPVRLVSVDGPLPEWLLDSFGRWNG